MTVDAKASQPIDELRQSAALVLTAAGTHSSPELEVKPDQLELQERERQQSPVPSLGSSRNVCRICHMDSRTKEPLISPCRCKGTLAYVHLSCLERWLNQSCRNYCELCNFRYNALETRRYRWYEGLRIWINHPRNRRNFRDDILILLLLTAFTVGVSTVCLLDSHYFMQEGERIGFSRAWTKPAITIFMFIIMLGYCAVAYPLIRNQAAPWYRWWRDAVIIRLTPGDYSPSNMESEIQYQQHQQNDLADERR